MAETLDVNEPIRLRPSGIGRVFTGGFLAVWLTGWAFGECFALWILIQGAISLLTGRGLDSHHHGPPPLGPALAAGAFLLVWLSFWTLGGVFALRELLRMIWAEDRLTPGPDGLEVVHQLGPFRSRRRIRRDQMREIVMRPRSAALVLETATGMVELTRLGTVPERDQAATRLRHVLQLETPAADATPTLPEGWEEIVTPEGIPALVSSTKTQATQARVAGVIALGFTTIAAILIVEAMEHAPYLPLAVILSAAALLAGYAAVWLSRGRSEWRIGSGRITLQRRFGSNVRELFEGHGLELKVTRDSDADAWYALEATAAPGAEGPSRAKRRRIHQTMTDPTVPRRLGAWLAARASMPFTDLSTSPNARTVALSELLSQLEQSGPLGRFASKFIGRAVAKRIGPQP